MVTGKVETLIMDGNLQLGTIINIIMVTWEMKIDGLPDFQQFKLPGALVLTTLMLLKSRKRFTLFGLVSSGNLLTTLQTQQMELEQQ